MGRYSNVGSGHIVEVSRFKHTPQTIDEPTKQQKELYARQMRTDKDLNKKYEMIKTLEETGLFDAIWKDGRVEFSNIICGINYDDYIKWYAETKDKPVIERDKLVQNIEKIFGDINLFLDIVEDDSLYGFDMIRHNDEIYIIDNINYCFIHWYKLTHIGRDFSTDLKTEEEIIEFLKRIKQAYINKEE